MIKKVLTKNKTKIIKKFPEYDVDKNYIFTGGHNSKNIYKIFIKDNKTFNFLHLTGYGEGVNYDTFERLVKTHSTPYMLSQNNADLIAFLNGSRDFPMLKEIEEEVEVPLADDEVLVPSYFDKREIYALKTEDTVYLMIMLEFKYSFIDIAKPWMTFNGSFNSIDELFKRADVYNSGINIKLFNRIYQFDTAQEFLEWSLEQIKVKG